MSLTFANAEAPSTPIHIIPGGGAADWAEGRSTRTRGWIETIGFTGGLGSAAMIPDDTGNAVAALVGIGTEAQRARVRFALAGAQPILPAGVYHITGDLHGLDPDEQALGWLLSRYRFGRYGKAKAPGAALKTPRGVDRTRIEAIAAGEALTRDLINTPANDMGPEELELAANGLAREFGGDLEAVTGDELLGRNFPMIHAVGRAASEAPRLLDLRWGRSGPSLTLVGKGVCFDTGGLNVKSGGGMALMKKDMGGAATVLGLARMIMALRMKLRLRVLVPALENAIGEQAMRPGDVLTSRKGLTVEITNTDAEGRLVLADALALADEEPPDLMISMATLTGAARVAVGPDIAPFFATEPTVATAIRAGGAAVADPVWELPFHDPYETMIEPKIADLDNAPASGFAGSITAALFLRRFVTRTERYAHFDIYGWQRRGAPGRPVGGVGQGSRAVLAALPALLGL